VDVIRRRGFLSSGRLSVVHQDGLITTRNVEQHDTILWKRYEIAQDGSVQPKLGIT
jgi:hypothetical protein